MNKPSVILNPKGMTLVELVMAMGVGSIVLLGAYFFLQYATTQYLLNLNAYKAEASLSRLLFSLQSVAMHAVNVRHAGNTSLDGTEGPDGEGFVREFSFDKFSDLPNKEHTALMYFAREGRHSTSDLKSYTPTGEPAYLTTAVFFRKPKQIPTESRSGAVIIDYGSSSNGILQPDSADHIFDHLVTLRLHNPVVSEPNLLQSIQITATAKYSTALGDGKPVLWCPPADITAGTGNCENSGPFVTISKTATLHFANNKTRTGRGSFEFAFGAYLFRPTTYK